MNAWRQTIPSLLLLALLLAGSRLAGQAIADDEILPARPQPQAAQASEVFPGNGAGGLSAVTVDFVKKEEILPPGVMFFNVFKIQNTGAAPVLFTPAFTLPAGTHLIIQEADQGELRLSPGEAKYMPVRVSFPADAAGGVPYKITGQIRDVGGQSGAAAHTTVAFERTSRWQVSTPLSKVYASSVSSDYTAVQLFLSNKGNARETIHLLCEAGELLKIADAPNGPLALDVPLRPSTDTVVMIHVLSKPFEGEGAVGDRSRLVIRARSHPDSAAREVVVIFDTKEGLFRNEIKDEAPINLRIGQADIGTANSVTTIGLDGTILYKDERTFRYEMETQQQMFGPKGTFDPRKNTQIRAGYETQDYVLQAGYAAGSAGISYQRKGNERSYRTAVIHNFNTGGWDVSGAYQQQLGNRVVGTTSASLKTNPAAGSSSVVADAGANIALAKGQRLSFKTTGSYARSPHESGKAFNRAGVAYDLDYNLEKGRLKLRASNQYASKNYAGSDQGIFKFDTDAAYALRPGSFIKLTYVRSSKKSESLSPEATLATSKKSTMEKLAANYTFSVANLPFALGATYSKYTMTNHIYALDRTVWSSSRSYGATAGTTITSKKNGDFFLSPSVQVGMVQASQNSWKGVEVNPANYNAKMSLKGRYKQVDIAADYELSSAAGSASDLGMNRTNNKRFQLASSYLLPLIANKLALSTSAEMAYDLNSKEIRTETRASLNYDSGRNWSFQASARFDPLAKGSEGDPSIHVTASRSFDMPQPRLKYYNLKVLFFKDFNGNRLHDEGDEGIGNVLVEIERVDEPVETAEGIQNIRFEAPALMSDPSGKVVFQKAPQGNYLLKLEELFPRMAFTNLYGPSLDVLLNKHVVVLVPYTESVTITGKVDITRDKYSRLVGISAKNIRITVTDPTGDQYHTLTSPNGDYIISVPYAEHYQLSMKNVLGDKFDLTNGEQELKVKREVNRYEIGFLFKEKGRSINFGG